MELYENIIENKPVNESEDYNDFVNRRRNVNVNKSIRTKVTTLKENGEIHSEIMGTKTDEEIKSSADGNNDEKKDVSNFQDVSNGDNISNSNTESPKENNVKPDTKKDNDTPKNKNIEDRTVFGMKPIYGYSLITVVALVGIVAAVKIFKN